MKLVILDRDGVINHDSSNYIRSVEQWVPLPGSIDAIARLNQAGFTVAVATNQSGIGRGYYSLSILRAMHDKMQKLVAKKRGYISAICYCPHTPDDNCHCRKPRTGLVRSIEKTLNCSAKGAWFVGDSPCDLQTAKNAACKPVLVKTGNGLLTLAKGIDENIPVFDSLSIFTDFLLLSKK